LLEQASKIKAHTHCGEQRSANVTECSVSFNESYTKGRKVQYVGDIISFDFGKLMNLCEKLIRTFENISK